MLLNFTTYQFVVLLTALILLIWGLWRIKREKKSRLKYAEDANLVGAIDTESPDEDSDNVIRRRAVASIETRFSFVTRIYVPLILIIAGMLLVVPYIPSIPATYVSVLGGAIAVLLGLAAKPLMENAIAGIVITFSAPIQVNDTVVIDGKYGVIENITLLYTVVRVWNWRRFMIPNYKLLGKEFENLSRKEEFEWAHVPFYVEPQADLELVKKIAKESMQSRYLMNSEPPSFWVMEFEADRILCWVAGWAANPAESWTLKDKTRKNLSIALKKHGIRFQEMQSRIHVDKEIMSQRA